MTTSPLTLVVKTPNQKVKDISVDCDLDWSVNRLKQHLSQNYPGRPKITEQKLIYSGRLLKGGEILKDILKHTYEAGQTSHTMHLLCSHSMESMKSSESSPVPSDSTDTSQPSHNEGLRHRQTSHSVENDVHTSQYQHYAQYYGAAPGLNHVGAEAATMPAMLPGMPYSPEQMMWFQQIYAQQMAQYMQYMQQGHDDPNVAVTTAHDPAAHAHHAHPAAPPNGQGQNQQVVMNAAGGQAMFEDEDDLNRDWLDVTYIVIRFTVLMMIVYFYSTLHRFVLVFGFFGLMWMYQAGWFRLQRRNAEAREQEQAEQDGPQEEVQAENENAADQPNEEENTEDTETAETREQAEPEEEPAPGFLRVALTFFVTFWTSLVPTQPPAVNAN